MVPLEFERTGSDGRAFVILPKREVFGDVTPWVWYAPTLPGLPGSEEEWMIEKFVDAGMAIAGIDVGESYGSPQGRSLYSALYEDLVKKRGFSGKACLLARSRGGVMTLSVVKGQGHTMWSGWFQCQELVDFVITHADKPDAGDGK